MIKSLLCMFCQKEDRSLEHLLFYCTSKYIMTENCWLAFLSWIIKENKSMERLTLNNICLAVFNDSEYFASLNHLTHQLLELFAKNAFWTLWRFAAWIRAKLAPIHSKRHLQNDSMPLFLLALCFTAFDIFDIFSFFLLFLSFFFAVSDWPSTVSSSKMSKKSVKMANFCHGVAEFSHLKFCTEFFIQIYDNFCVYFTPDWASHSGLSINGKIFSFHRTWV